MIVDLHSFASFRTAFEYSFLFVVSRYFGRLGVIKLPDRSILNRVFSKWLFVFLDALSSNSVIARSASDTKLEKSPFQMRMAKT